MSISTIEQRRRIYERTLERPTQAVVDDRLREHGISSPLEKLYRAIQRARDFNPYDLPDYGSGPTAGRTVPTLTWAANAAAGKSQQRFLGDADRSWGAVYGGFPTPTALPTHRIVVVTRADGAKSGVGWALEFITDDDCPCVSIRYNGANQVRVLVDGQFVGRAAGVMANANNGNPQALQVNFGSKAARGRLIRFEGEQITEIRGVYVSPGSRVWQPSPLDFTRCAWVGDSYTASATNTGVPYSFPHDNYAALAMRLLGITDANQLGVAGTGFVQDNPGTGMHYRTRLSDIRDLHAKPGGLDLVVLQGSINDRNQPPANVQAEVAACLREVRAIVGRSVPILVPGVCSAAQGSGYAADPRCVATEQAVAAAVAAGADPLIAFVPFSTTRPTPILYGDGSAGATGGNATGYTQPDLIHLVYGATIPGLGGQEYAARAIVAGMRGALMRMRS